MVLSECRHCTGNGLLKIRSGMIYIFATPHQAIFRSAQIAKSPAEAVFAPPRLAQPMHKKLIGIRSDSANLLPDGL
jgi:hypothetical protein